MILYVMIGRSTDGMPLASSIETDNQPDVQLSKKYLKLLAKKSKTLPERCSIFINTKVSIYFITTLGVCYLALCENTYPTVLAFSYLDELVKEFIVLYTTQEIRLAARPYSFIKFENTIQKSRQRYNNPSSLATKINLSDLSEEIKLRPPFQLSLKDLEPFNNGYSANHHPPQSSMGPVGPNQRLPPVSILNFVAMLLSAFCCLFNFVRAISSIGESTLEVTDGVNPVHGLMFFVEAFSQSFQIYLFLAHVRRKYVWTWLAFLVICLCNFLVFEVRDLWQSLLHVALGAFMTFSIVSRKPQKKAANYNV